jgi:hypothetical protein
MNRIVGLVTLLSVSAALPAAAQPTARGPQECAALQNLQVPGVAISEISAEWIPAAPAPDPPAPSSAMARPAHCRLQATLDRRQGVDGQPYGIVFALALPGTWNRSTRIIQAAAIRMTPRALAAGRRSGPQDSAARCTISDSRGLCAVLTASDRSCHMADRRDLGMAVEKALERA